MRNYRKLAEKFLPRVAKIDLRKALQKIIDSSDNQIPNLSKETEFAQVLTALDKLKI